MIHFAFCDVTLLCYMQISIRWIVMLLVAYFSHEIRLHRILKPWTHVVETSKLRATLKFLRKNFTWRFSRSMSGNIFDRIFREKSLKVSFVNRTFKMEEKNVFNKIKNSFWLNFWRNLFFNKIDQNEKRGRDNWSERFWECNRYFYRNLLKISMNKMGTFPNKFYRLCIGAFFLVS